jgi:hypothetical protein
MNSICFKSTPENFRKEFLGLKRNTVRKGETEDIRFDLLGAFIAGRCTDLSISIFNTENHLEFFERRVTDVTLWEGFYIISW